VTDHALPGYYNCEAIMTVPIGKAVLLEGLLPADVVVVELFVDPPSVDLFPQEAEFVAQAVDKRRREFATVRLCARAAGAQLGIAPQPIVPVQRGPAWASRAPRWPAGIVGSMTHCDGYRAAALARSAVVASVGMDAEPNVPLPGEVRELIALPEERRALDQLADSYPHVAWDRLLFSAKESVYKAWFPLTGRWLDFSECSIAFEPNLGTFIGSLKVPGPVVDGVRLDSFTGRWRVLDGADGGLLGTAVGVVEPRWHPASQLDPVEDLGVSRCGGMFNRHAPVVSSTDIVGEVPVVRSSPLR
jgi:4'-phosphopantetheinyl transferase EntD